MAFGPESCTWIDSTGAPLGTASNPLYIASSGVVVTLPAGHHETPDSMIVIDTTGTPLGTQANILNCTALN